MALFSCIRLQIRNPKHLPWGIQPLAGPHRGMPQGEDETNFELQMWDVQCENKIEQFRD
jgi:hypothetical protein